MCIIVVFVTLITSYIESINNDGMPCIENAINRTADVENEQAIKAAMEKYDKEMTTLDLPTIDDNALKVHHQACLDRAVELYMKKSFQDRNKRFQIQLQVQIDLHSYWQKKHIVFLYGP